MSPLRLNSECHVLSDTGYLEGYLSDTRTIKCWVILNMLKDIYRTLGKGILFTEGEFDRAEGLY